MIEDEYIELMIQKTFWFQHCIKICHQFIIHRSCKSLVCRETLILFQMRQMIVKAQCSTWTLDLFQPSILLQVLLLAYIQFLKFAMAIVYSCSCEL